MGHFEPATLFPDRPLQPVRSLDTRAVEAMLAECPPEVRDHVEFGDGYVAVQWAPCHMKWMEKVHQFAYRLAEQQQCIAAESPFYFIAYPKSAQQTQQKAADALMAKKRSGGKAENQDIQNHRA